MAKTLYLDISLNSSHYRYIGDGKYIATKDGMFLIHGQFNTTDHIGCGLIHHASGSFNGCIAQQHVSKGSTSDIRLHIFLKKNEVIEFSGTNISHMQCFISELSGRVIYNKNNKLIKEALLNRLKT